MLDGAQRQELCDALFSAFPTLQAFDRMLRERVNQRRERLSTGVAGGVPDVIAVVVDAAEREFWTTSLIAGALAASGSPGNPDLRAFIDRHKTLDPGSPAAAPVDHYQTTFFVGRRVFLCRPALRAHLGKLARDPMETRTLVVTGPRGCGKTYTRDFIGYLMQFDPGYQSLHHELAYVDLDQHVLDLKAVAEKIGAALRLTAPLPPRPETDPEQDSRWVPSLHSWLTTGINASDVDVWWLVLDGFRLHTVPDAGLDLIDLLADFADLSTTKLRLVLLNYPRQLPIAQAEDVVVPVVSRADVTAFIQAVYGRSGKPASPDVVERTVDEIQRQVDAKLAEDPTQSHLKLKLLSYALTSAAKKLLA